MPDHPFPDPSDRAAVRAWNHRHRPDLPAVHRWAAPLLAAADQLGPTPALGTHAWRILPDRDPRKLAAAIKTALTHLVTDLPPAIAEQLRTELDDYATAIRRMFGDAACQVNLYRLERGYSTGPSHAELLRLRSLQRCHACRTTHSNTDPCPHCGWAGTPDQIRAHAARPWPGLTDQRAA